MVIMSLRDVSVIVLFKHQSSASLTFFIIPNLSSFSLIRLFFALGDRKRDPGNEVFNTKIAGKLSCMDHERCFFFSD